MANSAAEFELELNNLIAKLKRDADAVTRRIILGVAERIDMRSPVGNPDLWKSKPPKNYVGGHFRANWQLGLNTPPEGVVNGEDASGEVTQKKIQASMPTPAYGHTYYLVNNVPYAMRLEEGWSTQAPPQGIVQLTVLEYQQIIRNAAASIK